MLARVHARNVCGSCGSSQRAGKPHSLRSEPTGHLAARRHQPQPAGERGGARAGYAPWRLRRAPERLPRWVWHWQACSGCNGRRDRDQESECANGCEWFRPLPVGKQSLSGSPHRVPNRHGASPRRPCEPLPGLVGQINRGAGARHLDHTAAVEQQGEPITTHRNGRRVRACSSAP